MTGLILRSKIQMQRGSKLKILQTKWMRNMDNTTSNSQSSDVRRILAEIQRKVEAVASVDLGYPLGENVVRPASTTVETSSFLVPCLPNYLALRTFYEMCDGIDLPNVGNGIFIHGRELIATNAKRGVPISLRNGGPILVFGSDGGGGMFAMPIELRLDIIYLPLGAVVNGEFDNIWSPTRGIAGSFVELLSRIVTDMDAFISRRPGWQFIA